MATANFTGDGKQQTFEQLLCSADLTAGIHGQLTFISVLNIFLSITAFFCNVLILFALRKESSLHPPSKLLLRSLATTDLCVGLISEPLFVVFLMSVVSQHWNICRYVLVAAFAIGNALCGVSLFTLATISVDRLLALLLGLRYKQVVTLKRTYVIVISFWVVCTVFSPMYFLIPIIITWFVISSISLCLVTSIFSYTKIFLKLRHHQTQLQDQAQQPNELNIARYRKAVSTALWLQLTLVACYLPFGVVMSVLTNNELASNFYLAWGYTLSLVFLNSSLNPILYCWKIDEVRHAVKDAMRQVLCCSSS
ncbi:melanocyte-stimulating hormone receptor-like [Oculina patagonica]